MIYFTGWRRPLALKTDKLAPHEIIPIEVNHRGEKISVYVWKPVGEEKPHPWVVIHDMAEDMTAWLYSVNTLVQDGYTVYAFDLRGHGLSKHLSVSVPFKQFWTEIVQIIAWVRERHRGKSPFIIAQGLGALLALSLNRYNHRFCFALVLASPMFVLSDNLSTLQIIAIKMFARFFPETLLPLKLCPRFTRNRKHGAGEDMIKIQPRVTGLVALELLAALTRIHKLLQRSFNPVLFLCPEVSPVHRYELIQRLTAKNVEENKVSYISLRTKYHSIVSDRAEVLDTIRSHVLPWAHRIEKGLPWPPEGKND